MNAASPDALKRRELVFSASPAGQAERALQLLSGLDDLRAEYGKRPNSVRISYSLLDYSLESLEQALAAEGFHFESTPLIRIGKRLIYYLEEMEYHNLNVPEWHSKNRKSEIFVNAYEHHLHGDHDDTPPELREYK